MSSISYEEAIDRAAEYLCIATALSRTQEKGFRSDKGVLLGLSLSPENAVLKIKNLLSQIQGDQK